jgi:hypothetical protein
MSDDHDQQQSRYDQGLADGIALCRAALDQLAQREGTVAGINIPVRAVVPDLNALTNVLLAVWNDRADAGITAGAEDHCRALAEAVAELVRLTPEREVKAEAVREVAEMTSQIWPGSSEIVRWLNTYAENLINP